VACFVATLAAASPSGRPPIRVFVETASPAPGTFAPPDYQERRDAVRDFRRFLPTSRKGVKAIAADTRETADVVLEVVGRERDPDARDVRIVRAIFRCGDYASEVVEGRANTGLWTMAADQVFRRFEEWLADNYDLIIAKRPAATTAPAAR
jgi:hypothetical protein